MNPDFRDLLVIFNARTVEYLVVGGYAVAAHGHVRATKDLDIWVKPDLSNAQQAHQSIQEFGAPLHGLTVEDLAHPGIIFQIACLPFESISLQPSRESSLSKRG